MPTTVTSYTSIVIYGEYDILVLIEMIHLQERQ